MQLIVFDIDGTLTATNASDAECYTCAFESVFGTLLPTTDWRTYRYSTDSGIIAEIVDYAQGRQVTQEEIEAFEAAFTEELKAAHRTFPAGFAEVPGARSILEQLKNTDGVTVAIATGGLRKPALFKLAAIGIDGNAFPAGFANDSYERVEIIRHAIRRAQTETRDIVLIGDAPWDVRAAAIIGARFIGITWESSEQRLLEAGATVTLNDYANPDAFFEAVRAAGVPPRTSGP